MSCAPASSVQTMKAWLCECYNPDVSQAAKALRCVDVPLPCPTHGQALVKVRYVAVDPLDWKLLSGSYSDRFPISSFPYIPGFDVAGEVVTLGPGCSKLKVGDRVVLFLGLRESFSKGACLGPRGALAEYCACLESQISLVPENVDLLKVAGLPSSGLTAYQALFTGKGASTQGERLGELTNQSKILVLGGNRGPGHLAVQMAHIHGAHVTTTVAPSHVEMMRSLGADDVMNFRESDWGSALHGANFDLILDCVGWASSPDDLSRAADVMRPGGQYISISDYPAFLGTTVTIRERVFKAMVVQADAEDLDVLVSWVADGKIQVAVDQECPFSEARHALHESVIGGCKGKVLVCTCCSTRTVHRSPKHSYSRRIQATTQPKLEVPGTMKAWQCEGYNPDIARAAKMLRCVKGAPVPLPAESQVLVRVELAAVDPIDWKLISGSFDDRYPVKRFPYVPGIDAAGEVVKLGPKCGKLKVGDRVVLCLGLFDSCCQGAAHGRSGTFAEYCVCPESQVSLVPEDVELSQVVGLPLAGLTAYQALFSGKGSSVQGEVLGEVVAGSKVLVLGGNRGPGHLAIQMAHIQGAHVTTTVAPSYVDLMHKLGANQVINFRDFDWERSLKGQDFDLVLDCVGWIASRNELERAADVLRPGGQYISLPDYPGFLRATTRVRDRIFKAMTVKANAEDLDVLVAWVAAGRLEVIIDQECPFTEARHALHESVVGQSRGKVILCMCGSSCSHEAPIGADAKGGA